jgi:hypothetical protein
VDYGVVAKVVSFEFVVSSFEFVTTFSGYGGELSSSTSLLVIDLVNTITSKSLL